MRKTSRSRARRVALGGMAIAGVLTADIAGAANLRFADFAPLTASAPPTASEATPITFGNTSLQQRSVADRATQLAAGAPNTGSWDMITVNETGPHKGSFLFTVFETS